MQLYPLKLVTIVAEEILKDDIQRAGMHLGATGYTTKEVHGCGSRGTRHNSVDGRNVQIDFIVPDEVAVKILTHVSRKYFENYACTSWVMNVDVIRGERYLAKK